MTLYRMKNRITSVTTMLHELRFHSKLFVCPTKTGIYLNTSVPSAKDAPHNVCYFKDFDYKAPADPDYKNYSI